MIAHKSLLLLAVATCLAFTPKDDKVTLRWKPTEGYSTINTLRFTYEVGSIEIFISMEAHTKVSKIEKSGAYSTETIYKNAKQKVMGEEEAIPDSEPQVTNFDEKGKPIKEKDEPASSGPFDMLGYVLDFEPEDTVVIGDKWIVDKDDHTTTYTLDSKVKIDDVDCYLIKAEVKVKGQDRAGNGTGSVWIKASDFDLVKYEGSFTDVKLDADTPSMKITFDGNTIK